VKPEEIEGFASNMSQQRGSCGFYSFAKFQTVCICIYLGFGHTVRCVVFMWCKSESSHCWLSICVQGFSSLMFSSLLLLQTLWGARGPPGPLWKVSFGSDERTAGDERGVGRTCDHGHVNHWPLNSQSRQSRCIRPVPRRSRIYSSSDTRI
jgi:hypothetical protein